MILIAAPTDKRVDAMAHIADAVLLVDAETQTFMAWKHRVNGMLDRESPQPVFSLEEHLHLFVFYDAATGPERMEMLVQIMAVAIRSQKSQGSGHEQQD